MQSSGTLGKNQVAEQGHQELGYFYHPILLSLGWLHPKPGSPHGCKAAAGGFEGPRASLLTQGWETEHVVCDSKGTLVNRKG